MKYRNIQRLVSLALAVALAMALLVSCTENETPPAKKTPVFSDVTPGVVSGNVKITSANDISGDVTTISCTGKNASIRGSGARVADGQIEITASGIYWLTGAWNGSVKVAPEADKDGDFAVAGSVELVFGGFTATAADGPALIIEKASVAVVTLADGTENVLRDAADYSAAAKAEGYDAALFAKCDLILRGTGKLTVSASCKDGVKCKDILTVEGGTYEVSAPGNGVTGRDAVLIGGGSFTLSAGSDALQATEELDKKLGYVAVYGGDFRITAGDEAIAAKTDVLICGGSFDITALGNGISAGIGLTFSAGTISRLEAGNDGLKAKLGEVRLGGGSVSVTAKGDAIDAVGCVISGGSVTVKSTEKHGINCSGDVAVTGGSLDLAATGTAYKTSEAQKSGRPGSSWGTGTGKGTAGYDTTDGGLFKIEAKGIKASGDVHFSGGTVVCRTTGHAVDADGDVTVSGTADVTIDAWYDGCNSKGVSAAGDVTVEGGTLRIERSRNGIDGRNVTVKGGTVTVKAANDGIHAEGAAGTTSGPSSGGLNLVTVAGGSITVDAGGDAIDSKGSVVLSGGTALLSGASDTAGAPLNRGSGSCSIRYTGGSLLALGNAGKTEAPSLTAAGAAPFLLYTGTIPAGAEISLRDLAGNVLLSGTAAKDAGCAILGCDGLTVGSAYVLTVGRASVTVTLASLMTSVGSGR